MSSGLMIGEEKNELARIPARLQPMMLTHLFITGDVEQFRRWRDQVETIRQTEAVYLEHDPFLKRILRRKEVWARVRKTGQLGAMLTLGPGVIWMAWLIPAYAIGHGFGWAAALTYLLPVPLAFRVARTLFEKSAMAGMRDHRRGSALRRRVLAWLRGAGRSYASGFAFGFTLTFLQGLISWFMTPAPTLGAELVTDFVLGTWAGMFTGGVAVMMTPLLTRPAPTDDSLALSAVTQDR